LEGLKLSSERRGDSLIVAVRGDLDVVTSREFDEYLTVARRDHGRIVLDLTAVDFMDTSALAVIVGHWKGLVAAGGTLSLAGPRYRYTKSLWITGLADRLPLYDTVDQAVAHGQADPDRERDAGGGREADTARPGPRRKQSSA
jgi:anti-sigma B factor antagonist